MVGLHNIAMALGFSARRGFEIDDVVDRVQALQVAKDHGAADLVERLRDNINALIKARDNGPREDAEDAGKELIEEASIWLAQQPPKDPLHDVPPQ